MIKKYDKLVRDRIPEIVRRDGHKPVFNRLTDAAFETKLFEKLSEEQQELVEDRNIEEVIMLANFCSRLPVCMATAKNKPSSYFVRNVEPKAGLKRATCLRKYISVARHTGA